MCTKHNVRVQHFAARRQRVDVALAWWIARTVPRLRERFEAYAIKRHRLGEVLSETTTHNIVTDTGFEGLAGVFLGTETAFTLQAVGTDATAEAFDDVALGGEIVASGLSRKAASTPSVVPASRAATSVLGPTLFVNNTAGAITIEESGIFNSNNVMYARVLTGTKELLPGQGVNITHNAEFSEV